MSAGGVAADDAFKGALLPYQKVSKDKGAHAYSSNYKKTGLYILMCEARSPIVFNQSALALSEDGLDVDLQASAISFSIPADVLEADCFFEVWRAPG